MNSALNKLIELGCYKEGEFTLKSGRKSNYYIDLRILVSYPEVLKEISNMIYDRIKDVDGKICGLPYAGIPYAQTISVINNRPMILLRKEQKKYGTSKMIEGEIKDGEEIIIIDDILTSGSSIIDSLEYLKKYKIKKILVIVDRNEGGKEKLRSIGYNVESVFTIDNFKNLTKSNMISCIRNIIKLKKSNICVSLDYNRCKDIIDAIQILKNNIVMVKIHCDIIEDFNNEFVEKLTQMCLRYKIFIIEDRKFGDIGNTFKNQFISGIYKIRNWANFVTFHGIVGEGQIKQFNSLKYRNQFIILVAEMSNDGNLIDCNYTNNVKQMALNNEDDVLGFVSQKYLLENFLCFTPGIRLENISDNSDQKYITPEKAINRGSDILIIGRGIIDSENILESCRLYQNEAWKHYSN